jgi:iron complex outermembrane recepter protein
VQQEVSGESSLVAIAACLVAWPALAQTADDTDRPERDTIIVIGQQLEKETEVSGRLGLTIRETAVVVDVVTRQDFHLQGVRTAIEATNAAPGVASGNLPGSIGSLSMRGFHRAVNYLYDEPVLSR